MKSTMKTLTLALSGWLAAGCHAQTAEMNNARVTVGLFKNGLAVVRREIDIPAKTGEVRIEQPPALVHRSSCSTSAGCASRRMRSLRTESMALDNAEVFLITGYPNIEFGHVRSPLSPDVSWAAFLNQSSRCPLPTAARRRSTSCCDATFPAMWFPPRERPPTVSSKRASGA